MIDLTACDLSLGDRQLIGNDGHGADGWLLWRRPGYPFRGNKLHRPPHDGRGGAIDAVQPQHEFDLNCR